VCPRCANPEAFFTSSQAFPKVGLSRVRLAARLAAGLAARLAAGLAIYRQKCLLFDILFDMMLCKVL
jgi:hypothetical protein